MSVTAERLMVEVQADVRQALTKLSAVEAKAASSTSRMGKMARSMGLAFSGAAVVGGITKTISLAMTFDKTMRQVGVQTDQSGKKLDKLGDLALKMGQKTVFSAQDAGGAMLELAKGGLTAAEMRAGALEQTLTLAAAGGLDLASAATYVTQGMNTFGLKAKSASQITTALAGGANASTASVESLGLALSQAGAGAVNAGMNIQETVAALAAFDNAGIKGSDAGTSLKTMLSSLVPATDKAKGAMQRYGLEFVKRNGDFKDMAQVAQELKRGLGNLGEAERVRAMKTIFGSDATRAATVLMKNGASGIRDYLKATKDQSKAQQMANAAMKGASGAWENFKGSVETAAIQLGQKMLPAFTKAANKGADFVNEAMTWGPQIKKGWEGVRDTFSWVPGMFKDAYDAAKPVVSLAVDLAGAWSKLPGPLKSASAELLVGIALWPRLSSAVAGFSAPIGGAVTKLKQFGAEMTYAETRGAALGRVAKSAAGPAGLGLLMVSAGQAQGPLKALTGTLGAAATGFSVGGPWGGIIGGAVGLFLSLKDASKGTGAAARAAYAKIAAVNPVEQAKAALGDLKDSLDQVTGAYTENTRAAVLHTLQESGAIDTAAKYGISARAMVNQVLGQGSAFKKLGPVVKDYQSRIEALTGAQQKIAMNPAYQTSDGLTSAGTKAYAALEKQKKALQENLQELKQMPGAVRAQGQAIRDTTQATRDYSGTLKGIPRKVRSTIQAEGIQPTAKGVAQLIDRYKFLDKRQIKTLIEASGADTTYDQVMKVLERVKELGRQKPSPRIQAQDAASAIISRVKAALAVINGTTATTYIRTVRTGPGGQGRGYGMATGGRVRGPGTGTSDSVPIMASNGEYVLDAQTTKRALPLIEALHRNKGRIMGFANGGRVGNVVGAATESASSMAKMMDALRRLIQKNMGGSQQAHWMKELRDREKRMSELWRRQASVQERLAKAQETLASAREAKSSFIENATAGMSSQATVLNAGNSAGAIANSLTVQVDKVKKFAGMLGTLRKMGYPTSIIRQVAEAGVEGGYQAAESLIAASKADQATISSAFTTINSVARDSSKELGAQMYDSGIRAAQGLVKGLKDRRKEVEDTIRQMAMGMAKALRAALGIHSPSRVFFKIAQWAPAGMVKALQAGEKDVAAASYRLGNASAVGAMASTRGLTTAKLNGGLRAGSSVSFTFVTHNPQAEPQSRTTNKALAKVGSLGLV
jgi:TP901 family phage tail tape measure protein